MRLCDPYSIVVVIINFPSVLSILQGCHLGFSSIKTPLFEKVKLRVLALLNSYAELN